MVLDLSNSSNLELALKGLNAIGHFRDQSFAQTCRSVVFLEAIDCTDTDGKTHKTSKMY